MRQNADRDWKWSMPRAHQVGCGSLTAALLLATVAAAETSGATGELARGNHSAPTGSLRAPLVKVEQGWLRGVSHEERLASGVVPLGPGGAPVDEFLGVPFAAPPVGALRFEPPRRAARWRGVRDARQLSVLCAQAGAPSSEDCLQLNVYRPRNVRGKLPVLFYIHGGSLMVGSASEYRARQLASEIPAVIVTTNYRLNVFGFLTLPASPASVASSDSSERGRASSRASLPGNYGLLDQQAALAWVQRNIQYFGGDASRVTIAGHSSGGSSVCAHLASPPAWGSFSGAMLQSAGCGSVERAQLEARSLAFASGLGCTDPASAADCLRALPMAQLLASLNGFQADFAVDPTLLPLAPAQALATGQIARVPTLLGGTHDETRIFLTSLFPLAPELYPGLLESTYAGIASEVAARYPAQDYADPVYAFSASQSDQFAACPVRRLAAQLSQYTSTYLYEFDDPAAPAPHWMPVPEGFVMGSTHSSDAPYIFDRPGLVQPDAPPFSAEQLALGGEVRRAFGAFLRTGDPSAPGGPRWPAYEPDTDLVLLMAPGGSHALDDYSAQHDCDLWDANPPPAP